MRVIPVSGKCSAYFLNHQETNLPNCIGETNLEQEVVQDADGTGGGSMGSAGGDVSGGHGPSGGSTGGCGTEGATGGQ